MITRLSLGFCSLIAGVALAQPAFAASTERVSLSNSDNEVFSENENAVISGDGRFVAFTSFSDDVVPGDNNEQMDVFVRDRLTGTTERVSVSDDEDEGPFSNSSPSISGDGRFVAFETSSPLAPDDTNNNCDIYVRDRQDQTTERVSVATGGAESAGCSVAPAISDNGRFVAFVNSEPDLVTPDTNGSVDVFLHDLQTGTTTMVSLGDDDSQGNGIGTSPAISASGRYIAFLSDSTDLTPDSDAGSDYDIFVRDRIAGTTIKVTFDRFGNEANDNSFGPSISNDGRVVGFGSTASDLVPGDTNGRHDFFVRDLDTGETVRVNVGIGAQSPWNHEDGPRVSGNGRFVAFDTRFAKIVEGDTNDTTDSFVRDLLTQTTRRVSLTSPGGQTDGGFRSTISDDGRFVTFGSEANDIVPDDTNNNTDVFVRDRGELDESRKDLIADLGGKGLWERAITGVWRKIDSGSPTGVGAGDLDRSFIEEVIASFPGRGLLARFNGQGDWQELNADAPDRFVVGDFDSNGVADIAGDFEDDLLVSLNNGAWIRRADASQGLAVGDLDGNGEDDLIADRGATGIFVRYNNANPFVPIHTANPVHIAVGDVDGDGLDDVIADLGPGQGIFVRTQDADPWRRVLAASSEGLAAGDLDGNGKAEIIGDFSNGLRARFNNANPWITLDTRSPRRFVPIDLDRNGEDDIVANFPRAGISVRYNNSSAWQFLRAANAQELAKGSFN